MELNLARSFTATAPESVIAPVVSRSKEVAVIEEMSKPSPSCILTAPPFRFKVVTAVSRVIVPAEPAAPSLIVKVVAIISVAESVPVSVTFALPTKVTAFAPASINPTESALLATEVR